MRARVFITQPVAAPAIERLREVADVEGRISGLNIKIIRSGDKKEDDLTVEINNA
jgi:hypothetical protein